MNEPLSSMMKKNESSWKKHLKWGIPLILIGIIVSAYSFVKTDEEENTVYVPEVYEVKKGSISSTVSSDGNIINPDILNLSFLTNGTLDEV